MRQRSAYSRFAGVLLLMGLIVPAVSGQAIVHNYPKYNASVDWVTKRVTVKGYAALPKGATATAVRKARAAAMANARQNLVGLAGVIVPIPETGRRRPAMIASVQRVAQQSKVLSERKLPDNRYEVTLAVWLTGKAGLSGVLAQELSRPWQVAMARTSEVAVRGDVPPTTGEESLLTPADAKGPFTGIVIDVRGYAVQTSMSPMLFDAKNKPVYSGDFADVDFVEDVGVVGYAPSIKVAKTGARVDKNPLILRAISSPDEFHRCAAVTEEDAARIIGADKVGKFLKKCAVTFVIDGHAAAGG